MTMDPVRQRLLAAKLGELLTWSRPDIVRTVGPYDPSIFEDYDAHRREIVDDCMALVRDYSEDRIKILADRDSDDPLGMRSQWREFGEDKIRTLTRRQPPWYAGGFGHPDHVADFDYWGKMSSFTLHEILCLSVGIEPDSFEPQRIAELSRKGISEVWPPLQFLVRRYEQLRRKFDPNSYERRVRPRDFLAWVDEVQLEAHPDLIRYLRLYHSEGAKSSPAQSAVADKREVRMIAQLFTAMAIDHLGYDPDQARSPIPKEIVDLAASMGLSVSVDTVLKYLRIGASFLPEDWKQD